jgi:two-component system, chemotaxis family, protein-glutamate methylesterase/glutaminase
LMRKLLADLLAEEPRIEVVGFARDGAEAVQQAARLKPDVVTLDVHMPVMSGLDALPALLDAHEAPVLMVSSLTQEGAEVTLAALELGAVDYLPKPERFQLAEMRNLGPLLVSKVLTASQSRVRRARGSHISRPAAWPVEPKAPPAIVCGPMIVVIGISTGGPQTLRDVFPSLTAPTPPIVVVQHMPPTFTEFLAQRLDRDCPVTVREARDGDRVVNNQILIAPGGRQLAIAGQPPRVHVALSDGPPVSGHKPSIDVLFQSAAQSFGTGAIGFLMTGMGRDGVAGCKAILASGGETYGQNEATSIVYGMNKAAYLEGAVTSQFAPEELPAIIRLRSRR